ncbi:metalloendopeptidase (plasmid) [Vescimonas fastidiosa]|uniref:Metalloendopeptidase n=1 Tax=Vescimonas fastidiosa TaxID=2714353 RepID=A0A810PWB2_9FIRM|nr:M23 family metallopeptidase [Vescimonas fastidiosa]BCK79970.1 metalloendopeptidase [Vescimonas fastidiosa]
MFSRKRALSLLCAACMAASLLCMAKPVPTYASSLSDQLQEARDAQAELEKQIEAIQSDKSKALEEKALLDRQNDKLRSEISLLQQQSDETQTRITELTQKEQEQYELFCRQVREEEERGTVSYWSVLFKASSFTDLLARMDFVNEVMDYDRQVISDLQTTRRQLTEDKAALEQQKSEMESSQTKLQQQVDAASTLIREYEETEAGHQAMLDEAAEDEARIQALIRQQQSGGSSGGSGSSGSNSGVDGYIWPTNNTRVVTSPYGERWCPFHGYESHNGADIDAARGSAVLAAKSGRVIQAGWNGGYGISVMIAHDDGITTLYGHMDGCSVSVGQTVSQGETIGICGNTGNSSGAHIHYTMYKNGGTIDPLPYLPGYIAWDW